MCNIIWDFLHIFYTFNGLVGGHGVGDCQVGDNRQKDDIYDVDRKVPNWSDLVDIHKKRKWLWH